MVEFTVLLEELLDEDGGALLVLIQGLAHAQDASSQVSNIPQAARRVTTVSPALAGDKKAMMSNLYAEAFW